MCDKAVDNYAHALEIVSDYYNAQKCVIQPSILILLQFDFFLNAIRLLKFMVKLLYLLVFFLYFILFQINKTLKKFMMELFQNLFYIALINIKAKNV